MATIDIGLKEEGCCALSGGAGTPSNTMWPLHSSSRLATTDMNRKLGAVPFLGGSCDPIQHNVAWAKVYLRRSVILVYPAVWPQRTLAEHWGAVTAVPL